MQIGRALAMTRARGGLVRLLRLTDRRTGGSAHRRADRSADDCARDGAAGRLLFYGRAASGQDQGSSGYSRQGEDFRHGLLSKGEVSTLNRHSGSVAIRIRDSA